MKIAIYPGSFDPFTNGHLEIIQRASKLFDKVYVLVAINVSKSSVFSSQERLEFAKTSCKDLENVIIEKYDGLVVDFAKKVKANWIIRGIRNNSDFDAEMQLFNINQSIDNNIDTIYLFPTLNNSFVSSTAIKEFVIFDVDITPYVPSCIKQEIINKIKERLHK